MCVIADLPGADSTVMGGIEATRVIRQHEANASVENVPIVALTAHAMLGDRERCLASGMTGASARTDRC